MNRSTDPILSRVFRLSLLVWRANYIAAKAATAGPVPKPAPSAARRKPAISARR
jgi:hypothetical protein